MTKDLSNISNVKKVEKTKKNTQPKKAVVSKKVASVKKIEKKKTENIKKVEKNTSTKISKSAKSTTKKTTNKKLKNSSVNKTAKGKKVVSKNKIEVVEYYDLPYRYNETIVKILVQTPKNLFVYWDISDFDRQQYILNYGENFFNDTYPVLIVHNKTYGYVQEIPINDFANSWYLKINDPRSEYSVELGRRFKNNPQSEFIYVKNSNSIIVPNDHILIDEIKPPIKYKNVKTNEINYKNISNIITENNKVVNIVEIYKKIFNVDSLQEINHIFNFQNPSSSNPTSSFK